MGKRRNSNRSKKPSLPTFNQKKITSRHNRVQKSAEIKHNSNMNKMNGNKTKTAELKSNWNMNKRNGNKAKIVEKENNARIQQKTFKRIKSEANSLPRGIDLGCNVNKVFEDEPKSMNDYVERERLRRQKRVKTKPSKNNKPKPKQTVEPKIQLNKCRGYKS